MGIAGIIIGIIGLAVALLAVLLAGWIGGVVAIVLGIAAIVLGILARKKNGKGGVGAIVLGAIAALIAAVLIPTTATMMKTVKENALKKSANFPIVSKYAEVAGSSYPIPFPFRYLSWISLNRRIQTPVCMVSSPAWPPK